MDKKKNESMIKKIFIISSILFMLFAIVFVVFQYTVIFDFSKTTFITIVSLCVALSIYCIFGIRFVNLIYGLPIIIVCTLSYVSTLPLVIITVLYLLPMIIAFSTENKPYVLLVGLLTVVGYFVFKMTCDYKSISYVKYERLPFVLGQGIPFLCEVLIVCFSLLPFTSAFDKNKKELESYNESLRQAEIDTVKFCIEITSYHSAYLRIHSSNVKEYTEFILDRLGGTEYAYLLEEGYRSDILFGAQLHDLGKCYISDSLLDKSGPLSTEEFNFIKKHTVKGRELFDNLPAVSISAKTREICRNIIYFHHERLDGMGYPEGRTASSIPLEAKLVAVADVTDALLSYRSYKKPFDKEEFLGEMAKERGVKLDPVFVDIITSNIDEILSIAQKGNQTIMSENTFSKGTA